MVRETNAQASLCGIVNAAVPCSGSAVILAKGLFLARVNGFSDGCRLHSSLRVLCSTEVVNKAMLSAF